MGKPTGFIEYNRKEGPNVPEKERVANWEEFHNRLPQEEQRIQGARCMDCGTPFCQSNLMLGGMASGCPLCNLIPEWNDLVCRGRWKEAFLRLMYTNNFPEFTGRVCPALCESACTAGLNGDPVSIRENERAIIETAYENGWMAPVVPGVRTGRKVAVIGSGPAGLAAADSLNRLGHSVTVYERHDRPGGLLMYGIPNMKLDKSVIMRRVDLMQKEGVVFRTGMDVGKNVDAKEIVEEYDAVVLACGASKPRDLQAEGRELEGIHFAVDYLRANTKSLLDSGRGDGSHISARDKDVIVIGGGDTGTDCVGTALRQGCRSVRQIEIMPELPATRAETNPWPQYRRVLKVDYGQQEHIALYGSDPRTYNTTVTRFEGEDGRVTKAHTVGVAWEKDTSGRFVPKHVAGSQMVLNAQLVLIAMGFVGAEDYVAEAFGVKRDGRGNVDAAYGDHGTNVEKIFAAGDVRRGQSLVVWGVAEGRNAALAVDEYLMRSEEWTA
ncbi:MAG: glutamate synthase subunit beta [Clostridiales bacterium]|nr:glutamate synthase subunit beta [Clostridiales bacterium]